VNFEIPFYRPPILATELDNGDLVLNMGKFAKDRLFGNTQDGAERFFVADSGAGKVKVWAPSLSIEGYGPITEDQAQVYSVGNGGKIVASAGEGDDLVDLSGVQSGISFDIEGGAGNDTIKVGAGRALIHGGKIGRAHV
jgi:hypothetical protein